jgi:hypothetical protein
LFQDYEECKYYQAQYGGSVHSIQKIDDASEVFERSPLGLDAGCDVIRPGVSVKFEHRGNSYFVLVLQAEKQLRNVSRYIKELLIQGHNLKLMQAYDRLNESGVKMYSDKTDCFTIPTESEAVAREVFKFLSKGLVAGGIAKTQIAFSVGDLKPKRA